MTRINRRDFLKLAGVSASALLASRAWNFQRSIGAAGLQSRPNVVVLVLDAMSARNLSLYGYPRPTTPNLEKFAERATVYHAHYAGGNFTTSGTASLLTGLYPWTHRAINFRGVMKRELVGADVFSALGGEYTRLAFPQNFWAAFLLTQLQDQIERLLPASSFSELDYMVSDAFPKDANMAARALDDFVFKLGGQPVPLVAGSLMRWAYSAQSERLPHENYPERAPYVFDYPINFTLEKVFSGIASLFNDLQPPFFAYLHLLPPHAPYTPTNRFHNLFKDGVKFIKKPEHPLSEKRSNAELLLLRRQYDEYIASTDEQLGKFLEFLESSGTLENSYVFITSDHGEMFERGEAQHSTPLLYEPVIHIPLLVSAPGQKTRRDVFVPTNAVDLLPTIAQLSGGTLPPRLEGFLLPGIGDANEDPQRSSFVVEAKLNPAYRPLKKATLVLRKGNQKMIYYTGYDMEDVFEFYDLESDPEEMQDLYPQKPAEAARMKEELLEAFHAANKPYLR